MMLLQNNKFGNIYINRSHKYYQVLTNHDLDAIDGM